MILRRWGFVLITLVASTACASSGANPPRPQPVQAEALVNESTIRARCVDPEGVIAGRTFCVLKDLPADQVLIR